MLLLLLACEPSLKLDSAKNNDSGSLDSGTNPTDSPTDSGTNPTDSGPIDDTGTLALTLGFELSGAWSDSQLTLTWLDPDSLDGDLSFGDTRWSQESADYVGLFAGNPPEEDLAPLDPVNLPGVRAAWYVPTLHLDEDQDGLQNGDEPYLGFGTTWALFLEGVGDTPPLPGLANGWNAIELDVTGGDFEVADPLMILLDTNLLPNELLSLAGGTSVALSRSARLGVYPSGVFEGDTSLDGLYDEPASVEWEIVLDGPPPDDHFVDLDGLWGALELGLVYEDLDSDTRLGGGDLPSHPLCAEGHTLGLLYLPAPTDLTLAASFTIYGFQPGWLGTALDEEGLAPFTADQLLVLDIGSCTF